LWPQALLRKQASITTNFTLPQTFKDKIGIRNKIIDACLKIQRKGGDAYAQINKHKQNFSRRYLTMMDQFMKQYQQSLEKMIAEHKKVLNETVNVYNNTLSDLIAEHEKSLTAIIKASENAVDKMTTNKEK
jgi:hypothetical protein